MDLKDVPYHNLFEEFVRRIAGADMAHVREGVAIVQIAKQFQDELQRRTRAGRIDKDL